MGRRSRTAAGQPEVGEVEEHPEVSSKCRKEGKFSSCCPRDSLGESLYLSSSRVHPKRGGFALPCDARGFFFPVHRSTQLVAADRISGQLAGLSPEMLSLGSLMS